MAASPAEIYRGIQELYALALEKAKDNPYLADEKFDYETFQPMNWYTEYIGGQLFRGDIAALDRALREKVGMSLEEVISYSSKYLDDIDAFERCVAGAFTGYVSKAIATKLAGGKAAA